MPRTSKNSCGLRTLSHDGPVEPLKESGNASFMPVQSQPYHSAENHDGISLGSNPRLNQAPEYTCNEHIAKKMPQKSRLWKGLRIVSYDGAIEPQAENCKAFSMPAQSQPHKAKKKPRRSRLLKGLRIVSCDSLVEPQLENCTASSMHTQSQPRQAAEYHDRSSLGRYSCFNQAPQQANDETFAEHNAKKRPRESKPSSSVRIVSNDGPIVPQAENGYASFMPVQSQSNQAAEGHDRESPGRNPLLSQAPKRANDDTYTEHIAKKKPRKSNILSSVRMISHDGSIESQEKSGNASPVCAQSQSHQAPEGHDSLGRNSHINQAPQQENDDICTEYIDMHGRRYKKQGKPTIDSVWKMNSNERIFIEVDKYGVPCTREGAILGSFLATVATNGVLAPLNFTWLDKEFKPYHQKMFSIVEERFMLPPQARKWVLKSINQKWKNYKCDLKARYFDMTKTRGEIEAIVPENVVPFQWLALIKLWYSEKRQRMSEINSANAKTNKNAHTCGRKSYGICRKELEEEMDHSPDRLTFYDAAHKRKDGTYVDENVKKLMEKAFSLQSKRSKTSKANITEINEQIFDEIMGDEHNGPVRGRGKGPTPKSYFEPTSNDTGARYGSGYRQTNDEVESLKGQLQEMLNKCDEVCEKYDEMSVQYKDIKENYEVLSAKYEEVSQTLLAMANFMSQKFPELQTPDNHHDQVDNSSSSRRSASDNNSYDDSDS